MRVVLLTGKGGVGKTTIAAATAAHAARCGLKVLVLSADPAHSLADALGARLGPEPVEVTAGLFGQQADPRARPQASWRRLQEYLLAALDDLGVDSPAAEELTELPGADDVFALLEMREAVRHGPWDLLVVDCGPSAETLRLLTVPDVLTRYLHRMLPMERRIARLLSTVRGTARRAAGDGTADAVVSAAERFLAELAGLEEVLRAPSTSIRLVLTPERVVLAETRRTWTALAVHGYPVDAVIANRVLAAAGSGDDPWRRGWTRAQAEVLEAARASFAPVELQEVLWQPAEPVGVAALAGLGAGLYGPPRPGAGPEMRAPAPATPFTVEREEDAFALRLPVPLAGLDDVELGRRGDDLVLTVQGHRRVVTLPSALRRCEVAGARLRDGALTVRFVPDPTRWRAF